MLQVARAVFLGGLTLALPAAAEQSFRWVLEDALETEFVPLFRPDVVGPPELRAAVEAYARGDYRAALSVLGRAQELRLPDGNFDFVLFVAAECYRALGLKRQALANYHYICRRFPESDKAPPSLLRTMEYAYAARDLETADSLFSVARRRWQSHPLYTSMLYILGKANYREGRYAEAAALLEQMPQGSTRYAQAQFLAALCRAELREYEKALLQLEYVRRRAIDRELAWEAAIVIADIYALQGNDSTALRFYQTIPAQSPRHAYALVKKAQALLKLGKAREARELAQKFIHRNPGSDYYFEMAAVLEQAYEALNDRIGKATISGRVLKQLMGFRLTFEINEELERLAVLAHAWGTIGEKTGQRSDVREVAEKALARIQSLDRRLRQQLGALGHTVQSGAGARRDAAERRYLMMVKDSIAVFTDSVRAIERRLAGLQRTAAGDTTDSAAARVVAAAQAHLDSLRMLRTAYEEEYALILAECFGDRLDREQRIEEDRRAQFVDWTFRKYQEKKAELTALNARLTAGAKNAADSADTDDMNRAFAAAARQRLIAELHSDRRRLVGLIESLVDMNPGGLYNPQFLMRLAELHYDQASDEFEVKLREYERRMADGVPREQLVFPDIDLSHAIACYAAIARDYPKSRYADMALFYHALALQKEEKDSAANEILLTLIRKYPQSPYFVEANMNIGRYYFDHPTTDSGRGYKRAEEAFRRVLYYRDHPQFVQALYHLGWCYYMQDQYDEAIAVYRYLVEEVQLDFGKARLEDNQVANPLLREEAIDYIAVSFDERRSLDDAVRFLRLVGSFDYSSMVLKRMGELREEVREYDDALKIYKFLESEYPVSIGAPDAALNVIKLYETMKQPDSALAERQRFFERFGRGSQWQVTYTEIAAATVRRIDSLALVVGLYVADAFYRQAGASGDRNTFATAARTYREIAKRYAEHPRASDARWNLALILETQLGEEMAAYEHYVAYSRLVNADSTRREQAALNAVAIAQRLIPPDSSADPAATDLAVSRVIEAVDNYTRLFPKGKDRGAVALVQATLFFNRGMYGTAARLFADIMSLGGGTKEYYEAAHLLGQCRFKEENWIEAAELFKKVYREGPDPTMRQDAYRLLLQSRFLAAKKLLAAQNYAAAAQAFLSIEQEYPGSEYSDVVLFNAAEAHEKRDAWQEAVKVYVDLARKYPSSKYAADALFNAASDCEKIDNFKQAAEIYEMLVAQYPNSEKAKDALFNLGFAYEKLGRADRMAEVQERYSRLYPGEKDVEVMLMRAADYYLKAGLNEKALAGYRAYIARFPRTDRCVEAICKLGKAYEALGDESNARLQYLASQKTDQDLVAAGMAGNSYYAAEAAYALARMQEKRFAAVKLTLPAKTLRQQQQKKAELLTEVAAAYQRVIEYQSERMFEAAYRIGALYDQLASAWIEQEREKLDPVKQAVFDKDLYTVASSLVQKSFIPYKKAIELAAGFDSLGMEQRHWVDESRKALLANYYRAGHYLTEAVAAMHGAPVPKQIEAKPLYYFQYQKQLLETLEPMKIRARDYYLGAYRDLVEMKVSRDDAVQVRDAFGRTAFLIGGDYADLAQRILAAPASLPKNLDEVEREDIIFQLEDLAVEVQDRAIAAFEDGCRLMEREQMVDAVWYPRMQQALAKLDPNKYGKNIFAMLVVATDHDWALRPDSVARWNTEGVTTDGWHEPEVMPESRSGGFPLGNPRMLVRGDSVGAAYYLRRNVVLRGEPRGAAVYVAAAGAYQLYVNGTLTLSDTAGNRTADRIDSTAGFTSLLRGGDNVLACRVAPGPGSPAAIAVVFSVMIDTSKTFESSAPPLRVQRRSGRRETMGGAAPTAVVQEPAADTAGGQAPAPTARQRSSVPSPTTLPTTGDTRFGDRRSVRAATLDAEQRLRQRQQEIKHEEMEIQKLQLMLNAVNLQLEMARRRAHEPKAKKADSTVAP